MGEFLWRSYLGGKFPNHEERIVSAPGACVELCSKVAAVACLNSVLSRAIAKLLNQKSNLSSFCLFPYGV